VESYRALARPTMACRYEFPETWPHGINPQPGDTAARELTKAGKTIVNIGHEESSRHVAQFRSTTGIRSSREQVTRAAGSSVFWKMVEMCPEYVGAAYDNLVLGCLYDALYREPFAVDSTGVALAGSLTVDEIRQVLNGVHDADRLEAIRRGFRQSHDNILRMARREGVELAIPSVLPETTAVV
jgi:hypothetical protein